MKLARTVKYAGPAVLLPLLFAAPAFAQFEVNPDHFDSAQASTQKNPAPKVKANQAQPGSAKHSANKKSSKNNAAAANSASNKAAQSAGQANATSTATSAKAKKLQSQNKNRTSSPMQHLSAHVTPVPRE